jgi:uncharacterized protein YdeI (YjbR/CyaY-like superfamily)
MPRARTSSRKAESLEPLSVRPKSRVAWRRWLEKNHGTVTAALVVFARKGSGEPSVTYEESVEEALCFGWIDGVRRTVDATHYVMRFTPRRPKSIWSQLNVERVARLTRAGLMHAAGRAAFELAKKNKSHQNAYRTRDPVAMPPELRAALSKNRRGREAFEQLTPGQKKAWSRWVTWVKGESTRKSRAESVPILILAGRKAGETDAQAARRGVRSKAEILGRAGRKG